MATFGIDINVLDDRDLDPTFTLTATESVLLVRLARRFSTRRGGLDFHPDDGFDLRQYLNGRMDVERLMEIKTAMENEAEKDVDVVQASCIVRFTRSLKQLSVTLEVETTEGTTESLTMTVTAESFDVTFGA